jgi:hypothetical protein
LHDEGVVLATECLDDVPQLVAQRAQKLPSPFMAPARAAAEELAAPPTDDPAQTESLPVPSSVGIGTSPEASPSDGKSDPGHRRLRSYTPPAKNIE